MVACSVRCAPEPGGAAWVSSAVHAAGGRPGWAAAHGEAAQRGSGTLEGVVVEHGVLQTARGVRHGDCAVPAGQQ